MKKNQNFKMVAGDSKTIIITVDEDLNGVSTKWGLISKVTNTPILIKNGQINGDKIEINLEPSDTENLSETSFFHECEITDQQSKISTITTGNVKIEKSNI